MNPSQLASLDSEWCQCCGYYLACYWQPTGSAAWVPFSTRAPGAAERFLAACSDNGWAVAGHNIRSDFHQLGVYPEKLEVFDSLVLSWLDNENGSHKLKELAPRVLGRQLEDPITTKEVDGVRVTYFKGVHIAEADQREVEWYCREDAKATLDLALHYWGVLPNNLKHWYADVEMPLDRVVFEMEQRGIRLDTDSMVSQTLYLRRRRDQLEEKVYAEVGYRFNVGSPDQVAKVLFTKEWTDKERGPVGIYKACRTHKKPLKVVVEGAEWGGYKCGCEVELKSGWVDVQREGFGLKPRKNTPGGKPAVDEEVLLHYADHEVVSTLLDYRETDKVLGYLEAWPKFAQEVPVYALPKESPTSEGMRAVRENVRPNKQGPRGLPKEPVLFKDVRPPSGEGQRELEGRGNNQRRLPAHLPADAPEREEHVYRGTPLGSGAEVGQVPRTGGGRTPRQRGSGRQPTGEPMRPSEDYPPSPGQSWVPEYQLRLYGHFNTTGTVTGRFSSSDPNLQNIPSRGDLGRRVRGLFIPEPGHLLVVADLDQLELRLLASFCKDPAMLAAFESGEDVHQATADLMGVDRDLAKNINYSIAYDASAKTIQRKYAPNQSVAFIEDAMETHQATFPAVYAWKEQVRRFARKHGFVYTIGMRKRHLPDVRASIPKLRFRAERQAVNCVIQGSAGDIMRKAMVYMGEQELPLLLQVHDEVVLESPEQNAKYDAVVVARAFYRAGEELGVKVPLTCNPKLVSSWGEGKDKKMQPEADADAA